jgi:hypothetical protein
MTDRRLPNSIAEENGVNRSPGLSIAEVASPRTSSTIFRKSPMPACFANLPRRVDKQLCRLVLLHVRVIERSRPPGRVDVVLFWVHQLPRSA